MHRIVVLAAASWTVFATHALAQTVLTFEDTIARAREQAGAVVVASARVAEAEAGAIDASLRFAENPLIEAGGGPRYTSSGRPLDLEFGITQQLQSGSRRRTRVAAAEATIVRERADVDAVRRQVVFEAAEAFIDGVAASERLRIAEESDTVSRELLRATERRYAAGDVAALDLNLARIEAARSTAILRAARADLTAAVGGLRELLRLPATAPIELRGTLERPPLAPLGTLRTELEMRPDLVALRAQVSEADAQGALGRALTRPELGVRVAYEREETDSIVLGGLTVPLPIFQQGRGAAAVAGARVRRARTALNVAVEAATAQLETAYAAAEQHDALAAEFTREALPGIDDNESLGRRSYEAGELSLMELLLIRRDALETRTALIEHRATAAHRRLHVEFVAGVLR